MPETVTPSRRIGLQSIRVRLSLMVALVVLFAVMATAVFSGVRTFERDVESRRELLAGMASAYSAALSDPVAAEDRQGANQVLRGIAAVPGLVQADVITHRGVRLADFGSGALLIGRDGDPSEMGLGQLWSAKTLRVEVPVVEAGEIVGQLGLTQDISDLREAVLWTLSITGLSALLAVLAALVVAQWLIARMTRPLRQLTEHMAAFGAGTAEAFDTRRVGRDETGVLARTYNTMIASIRERDERIARHMETLEETVEERTADLRVARDEAEAANAAKSDFLATMSHEIRTPMNGIMVMAEMLSGANLSSRHRRYADIISRSGKGLLTIINDILDLSKIESGKLDIEAVSVSPDALVCDLASLYWERAREKGLALTTHVAANVPEQIVTDPTRLNQVLSNLVNNALKFTETGGVDVRVSAVEGDQDGQCRLIAEVEDTGIGIPADKVEHVFEAFSQADQSTTRRFGGTGLGLAVCRRLATAMDGEISVTSVDGEGSTFRLEIPVAIEADAPGIAGDPVPVCLAVQDKAVTEAVARSLTSLGGRLVASGAAFTLVVSDAVPEGLEGPVVLLSDIGDTRADSLIRDGKAVDVLPNPFTRGDLIALLERARTGAFRGEAALDDGLGIAARQSFAGLRVLAADDNAVNREVLREALSSLDVDVDFAEDGAEAVRMARDGAYGVVFMDGSMPVMDGFEATRQIRADEAETGRAPVSIIALTAKVVGADQSTWEVAGADGYMTKPFTIDRLADALSGQAKQAAVATAPDADSAAQVALFDEDTLDEFNRLAASTGNDLKARIWAMFREKAPAEFEALHRAMERDVPGAEVSKMAHGLKSMALSAGAARFANACGAVETLSKLSGDSDQSQAALRAAGQALIETLQAMGKTMDTAKAA
ncbi:MAG: ATP-binding protein [Pseudomonadota bacterium]